MLGFPSGRGEPHHMGHIQPFSLCAGGIQSVAANILRSAWGDVLRHFEEETR